MADLEAVLADVSYLMAMERSKGPTAKAIKKLTLPDASIHSVVHLHLQHEGMYRFEILHTQRMGAYYLSHFIGKNCVMYSFLRAILQYEGIASHDVRRKRAKEIYDKFILADKLSMSSSMPDEIVTKVSDVLRQGDAPPTVYSPVKQHLYRELHDEYMRNFSKSPEYVRFCQWKYLELLCPHQISLQDFSIHRIIGRGGFGEVYGCRKDDSGKMFAMKLLDKKRIKIKSGEYLAINERNMLAKVDSPFVVSLYYAFQTPDKLCFILDLMNGGDLHYHLTQHGVFNEESVRFYASELVLSLEHIHRHNIVYRDLKPSNILLDEQGHIRISDLGLACEFTKHQPSSSVGTHGYMAPEVIKKGVQYTFSADWFSLGCVLYKLLKGHSPFRSSNVKSKEDIDQQTLTKEVQLSSSFSPEMTELLAGLLQKEPAQRLGCQGRGSEEVKGSSFFTYTNWDDVLAKKLKPPLIPPRGEVNAADAFDIGNFDDDDTKKIKLTDEDQKLYKNFNLLIPDRWQAEMMEGIFDNVNAEKTRQEERDRLKCQKSSVGYYNPDINQRDSVIQGYAHKLGLSLLHQWQRKYLILYPNRLEWGDTITAMNKANVLAFDAPILVEEKENRGIICILLHQIGNKKDHWLRFDSVLEHEIWMDYLRQSVIKSDAMLNVGPKLTREHTSFVSLGQTRRQPLQQPHKKLHVVSSLPLLSERKI